MAGRARGRNSRFHYVNPRNEHDDRGSRPSTSRGGGGGGSGGGYSDRHNFNKKVTFKANNRGGNNFRKSWDNKTDLVREQLDGEFSTRNGYSRNNSGRRSYPERNNSHGSNFRNSYALNESLTGWYSIFVPNVDDCDEVLKIIQTYITPVVFFPYNKQFFDNALRFVVDDYKVAKTLHNTSYKITLRDDRKLIIKVSVYSPARGAISFTPVPNDIKEKMVEAMASRYNSDTKSLDLSKFYACPLFTNNQLFVPLNRPAVLLAALNIVAQHTKHDLYGLSLENNHIYLGEGLVWIRRLFPGLKVLDFSGNKIVDLKEFKSLSGFTIEVLNLSRNPVCNVEDKEKYRRDVQQYFPMVTKLDNIELPSQYSAIVGSKLKMPINLGNSYPIPEGFSPPQPNPVLSLVESFLSQYYERYDNNVSRQLVAEAYHENASFTISSCFLTNHTKGTLSQYLSESRNFLKSDRNKHGRSRYVHKGRENIINFLDKLPRTKHDIGSFLVDVPLATAAMVQIVINGVFAEDFIETNHRHIFRSFCRTFCIIPFGNGWTIISDMIFITVVSDELLLESSKRFYTYKAKPVPKKQNTNGGNNNASMFMEDNEMCSVDLLPPSSPVMPNFHPSSYQQTSISSYQSSTQVAMNAQQPPPYPGNMQQMPVMQNQQSNFQQQNHLVGRPAAASFQSNQPQSNVHNASFSPIINSPAFSTNSTSTPHVPINQLSNEVHTNVINDPTANSNQKLVMIKNFSNESGMNHEWTKKCLEENGWDYAKAAYSFSKLKPNIPPAAFIRNT